MPPCFRWQCPPMGSPEGCSHSSESHKHFWKNNRPVTSQLMVTPVISLRARKAVL